MVYGVIYAVAATDYDKTTPDLSCNVGLVFGRPNHLSPTTAGLGTPDQRQTLRRDYDKSTTKKGNQNLEKTPPVGGGPVAMEIKDYGVMYAVATTDYGKTTTNTACAATLRQDYDRLRHDYAMSVAFSVLSKTFL